MKNEVITNILLDPGIVVVIELRYGILVVEAMGINVIIQQECT